MVHVHRFKRNLPTIVAAIVFVSVSVGLIARQGLGTLSGFGWESISVLCPMGALTAMIASKTFIPRAVVSLVVMLAVFFVAGRVFCGYVCPVPLLKKIKGALANRKKVAQAAKARQADLRAIAQQEIDARKGCAHNCQACASKMEHGRFGTRHVVLLGALGATAVFGFPVFCLICPIGLTFGTVLVVWRLFAFGDVTVSVIAIPLVLVLELVVLRKWCLRFCPLSALMTLLSRRSKTLLPSIDDDLCLETTKGKACSKCAEVCDEGINLRHLAYGTAGLPDCTRCRACVNACPAHAVSMPFVSRAASAGREAGLVGARGEARSADAESAADSIPAVQGTAGAEKDLERKSHEGSVH